MRASTRVAALDVARRWTLVLAGALLAACACVLLALVVARWLLRPLKELDRGVRAVAEGQLCTHVADTAGPAELRALSESFNRMSDAVAEAADQQRRLIADASHQLRNPMAALRLRVDMLPQNGSLLTEVRPPGVTAGRPARPGLSREHRHRTRGGRHRAELADLEIAATTASATLAAPPARRHHLDVAWPWRAPANDEGPGRRGADTTTRLQVSAATGDDAQPRSSDIAATQRFCDHSRTAPTRGGDHRELDRDRTTEN